ncbi:MAG: H+/Na+-translocating ferredoxin:NAD+ oxidoreductase subunit [Kosmotogales bacterium]|nr:H+/Na+-translocating ferredoxin:NAD+ oxidoreductase subunit [Kosmotogales bacterium]
MEIIFSILILGILGIGAGTFLSFASAKFAVKKDPREELINAALPGINCGACGFPGCSGLAKAIAKGEAKGENCIPGKRGGVPEKIKTILSKNDDELITAWEKSGENPEKAIEILSGGKSENKTPVKKPSPPKRPGKDELQKYLKDLENNPMAKIIYSVLPKINCGVCGEPGCAAFAIKLSEENISEEKCMVGKRQKFPEKLKIIKKLSEEQIKKILEETGGDINKIKEIIEEKLVD